MVRQPVVCAAKVEPFVLNACPEIPITFDEEAMSVAEVIVERLAVSEFAVVIVEIAVERVVHLIIEQISVICFRWRGRGLGLERRRSGNG